MDVESFLHSIVDKVAQELEILRSSMSKTESGKFCQSKGRKYVHFASPLITEAYSQSEDGQTQDTLPLDPDNDDYDFDMFDSEEESCSEKKGDFSVPALESFPINVQSDFEIGDIFPNRASSHVLMEEGRILVNVENRENERSMDGLGNDVELSTSGKEKEKFTARRYEMVSCGGEEQHSSKKRSHVDDDPKFIENDNDVAKIDLEWYAEVMRKKSKQNVENLSIDELRRDLVKSNDKLESLSDIKESCGREVLYLPIQVQHSQIISSKYPTMNCRRLL